MLIDPWEDFPALQTARATWGRRGHDVAIEQFRNAVQERPENLRARMEYAKALGQDYRVRESLEELQRARNHSSKDPRLIAEVADGYAKLHRLPEAVATLESIPEGTISANIQAQLAVYLEQLGQFESALEHTRKCISAAPNQLESRLIEARIQTHIGQFGPALQTCERILAILQRSGNRDPKLPIRTHYQRAVILDRIGDYAAALQAANEAKAIQRQSARAKRLAESALRNNMRLAEIYKQLDADRLRQWWSVSLPALECDVRPAHLIGFPRSGTTLFEQILDAHPDVVVSSERMVFAEEILPKLLDATERNGDFSRVDTMTSDELAMLRRRYLSCLQSANREGFAGKVHLDKKPANLPFLFGILRLLPESKIIVAIRDPRDVIVSCYMRFFPLTDLSACFLSWGGAAVVYQQIMEIWLYLREIVPSKQWREIRYEDVCHEVVTPTSKILDWLGVTPSNQISNYLKDTSGKYVHSPTFAEVRKPVHLERVGRWRNYQQYLEPHLAGLRPFVDALDYD